jgi:site-specific DNA-cytosine methylase
MSPAKKQNGSHLSSSVTQKRQSKKFKAIKDAGPILPWQVHALWQLFKERKEIAFDQLTNIGRDLFRVASRSDLDSLIVIGQSLRLLRKKSHGWHLTEEGLSFSRSPHWRLWTPRSALKRSLERRGLTHLFIPKTHQKNRPKVIDLFSGAGGMGLGFEAAGFSVAVAVDNDPQACQAHRKNFPEAEVVEADIELIAKAPTRELCDKLGLNKGEISGIIGGPPCQGFSFIGERVTHDERNLLTSRFADIVLDIEPSFFVMENVKGLLTSGRVPPLDEYLPRLGKNIGEPATAIVDQLPKPPKALAKRDKQYRRRLVSGVIDQEKMNLAERIDSCIFLPQLNDVLVEHFEALKSRLSDTIENTYASQEDLAVAKTAVAESDEYLLRIALGNVFDVALKSSLLKKDECEFALHQLQTKRVDEIGVCKLIESVLKEYKSVPPGEKFKGVQVGPVLWHLVQRLSVKYDVVVPKVLNAAHFGTPQDRERLFLVGIRRGLKKAFVFPQPIFRKPSKEKASALSEGPTCYETIGNMPNIDRFDELIEGHEFSRRHLNRPTALFSAFMSLEILSSDDLSLPRPSWNPFVVDCSRRTLHATHAKERIECTEQGVQDDTSHRTRLHRNRASHTIRAGTREGKGSHTAVRPIHYEHHRVISVREGARLMGYPDWMTFHRTKWHGFRLVGNGVPAPLAKAIAEAIKKSVS